MMNIRSVTLEKITTKIVESVVIEVKSAKIKELDEFDRVIGEFIITNGIKFIIFAENINAKSRKLYLQKECKLTFVEWNFVKEKVNEVMSFVCDELKQIGYYCYFNVQKGRWTIQIHGSSEAL